MAKQDDRFLSESSWPSNATGAEWKGFKTTEAHFVRPEEIPNQSCYLKEFRDEMTKRIEDLRETQKKDGENDQISGAEYVDKDFEEVTNVALLITDTSIVTESILWSFLVGNAQLPSPTSTRAIIQSASTKHQPRERAKER